jgi:hypothetical protein
MLFIIIKQKNDVFHIILSESALSVIDILIIKFINRLYVMFCFVMKNYVTRNLV